MVSTAKNNGYYVFISLDIVNSTLYKTKDPDWSRLFVEIYSETVKIVEKQIKGINLWKTLGDELLFYQKITGKNELIKFVNSVYEISIKANNYLSKISPKNIPIKLAFKTTLFSGIGSNALGTDKNKWKYLNLVIPALTDDSYLDFIGPDIDTGFRISKYSFKKAMVIDAKLSCLLAQIWPEFNEYAKIVYFEQFKGVWDGNYYPVIWFSKDWKKLSDSFDYEDKFNSKIVLWIETENNNKFRKANELVKIFKQLQKTQEVDAIKKLINVPTATKK